MTDEKSIEKFIHDVAAGTPTPGGGSVSALSGSMGAALLEMAVRISTKNDSEEHPSLSKLASVRTECSRLIKEDARAFTLVMGAYGLPKTNDDEKKKRSAAIQEGLKRATEVPLATAEHCIDLMQLADELFGICKESCFSDAAVGFYCAEAGFQGALANVAINLTSLKDEDFRKAVKETTGSMKEWLAQHESRIKTRINERLKT
jgi:methenyltetrahydrofolate cyclohydrolase